MRTNRPIFRSFLFYQILPKTIACLLKPVERQAEPKNDYLHNPNYSEITTIQHYFVRF